MFLIAQVFGIFGAMFNVMSIQFDKKKFILIFMILARIMFILNYVFLDAYSGALIYIFSIIIILITYMLESKLMKTPSKIIPVYMLIYIILGISSYNSYIDILPIIAGLVFALMLIQDKEKNIRKIMVVNILVWTVYSMYVSAYTTMIFNILYIISITIAIVRYDIIKKDTEMIYLNEQTNEI